MVENNHDSTYRERTEIHESRSNSGFIAFIVGGLVVAVGVISWVVYGSSTAVSTSDGGGKTEVSTHVDVGGSGGGKSATDSGSNSAQSSASTSSGNSATAGATAGSGN